MEAAPLYKYAVCLDCNHTWRFSFSMPLVLLNEMRCEKCKSERWQFHNTEIKK